MFSSWVVVRMVGCGILFYCVCGGLVIINELMFVVWVGIMFIIMLDGYIVLFFGMYRFICLIGIYCLVIVVFGFSVVVMLV